MWSGLLVLGLVNLQLSLGQSPPTDPLLREYAPGRCVVTFPPNLPTNTVGESFRLEFIDYDSKYQPEKTYRIALRSSRDQETLKKFTSFILTVNPKDSANSQADPGFFQLFRDALSRFSEVCQRAVVQTSSIPKSDIHIMWTAPQAGTGCILISATVQDTEGVWHRDQKNLMREFCDEESEPRIEQEKKPQPERDGEGCCACSDAEYEMIFEGLWSKETHPKDFPENEWFTHFSDIIGASHADDFRIFEDGGVATEGVKQAATTGFTKKLETELQAQPSKVRSIIKARGLWHPNVKGRRSATFTADRRNHLLSFLSMIGPSPDWIVGTSALDLCLKNCSWISGTVENLYLWDAGVANGVKYQGDNSPTVPQERIQRITATYPNTPESPFYDPSGTPMKPMARLHLRRQRVEEKECDDAVPGSQIPHSVHSDDNDGEDTERPECRVTKWTEWSSCSVTCGMGVSMRNRQYLMPQKADMMGCEVPLVEKQKCEQLCAGNISCQTTPWSEWSECSTICGKGTRYRTRRYLETKARKVCSMELTEKEPCMGMKPVCDPDATPDPRCAVTPWSEWSPCTVTCGKGQKIRTRLYMNPNNSAWCSVDLMQMNPCMADIVECSLDPMEAKRVCMMPKKNGPCRGYFPRWYYDFSRKMCAQFIYGGCRGNRNNFERHMDCYKICEAMFAGANMAKPNIQSTETSPAEYFTTPVPKIMSKNPPVDCVVGQWSEWSECSRTCGPGVKARRKAIIQQAENGGQPCPSRLTQVHRCVGNPPCPSSSSPYHRS